MNFTLFMGPFHGRTCCSISLHVSLHVLPFVVVVIWFIYVSVHLIHRFGATFTYHVWSPRPRFLEYHVRSHRWSHCDRPFTVRFTGDLDFVSRLNSWGTSYPTTGTNVTLTFHVCSSYVRWFHGKCLLEPAFVYVTISDTLFRVNQFCWWYPVVMKWWRILKWRNQYWWRNGQKMT